MKIEKLQYITNGTSESEILDEVRTVIAAGCKWVQLRIKNAELDFFEIAKKAKKHCANEAVFIINDRIDIAKLVDADGVHLGLDDESIEEARSVLGPEKIIGGTANTKAHCLERQDSGADYIGLGPFRKTKTKSKLSPLLGLEGYGSILPKEASEIKIPVVAIGGIELDDIEIIQEASNVYGIAVSGLLSRSPEKTELIQAIQERLN